jgi:hypothetical protein
MANPLALDIVDLIENNPNTRLSKTYQHKLLTKIKANFTDHQQQMFVTSFYCYLQHDPRNDFVIDLDNVWKWLGFSAKHNSKYLLEKQFIIDIDYKIFAIEASGAKKNDTRGGHNKEIIMLNIDTFKKFCLKACTKKADEIHDYYLKLEETLHQVLQEESEELKLQLQKQLDQKSIDLQQQTILSEKEKERLREKTILEHFPPNTQCVYYGRIDNLSATQEPLIKFGNSNNLKQRVKQHKDTYNNFCLVNAFKVDNKLQIETAIKQHPLFLERTRSLNLNSKNYVELLHINGLSFLDLDKIFREIITSIEYSPDNYMKLLAENKALKLEIKTLQQSSHLNDVILLKNDKERLTLENLKLIKKYNTLIERTPISPGLASDIPPNVLPINSDNVLSAFKKHMRNKQGVYCIDGKEYIKNEGTRQEVWDGIAYQTSGLLKKFDLSQNKNGKIISKKKAMLGVLQNHLEDYNETR